MKSILQYLWDDFISTGISYTTWTYFLLVGACLILYYLLPKKTRWFVLFLGSWIFLYLIIPYGEISLLVFFERAGIVCTISERDIKIILFCFSILFTFLGGIILQQNKKYFLFLIFLLLSIFPLLVIKIDAFTGGILPSDMASVITLVGLSFYSLQEYAYLHDVYNNKTQCQQNLLKLSLFISFFPQILQGPIPRYNQLKFDLFQGNTFDGDLFIKGNLHILWGFFLKYMIADKASIFVDNVFKSISNCSGLILWVAAILYSIQLYTDFSACVNISQGVALLFGIRIPNNFDHPYFAISVQDFWKRWHMSLSLWLRDYVYFPLGGSRKGKLRKYFNIIIVFLISGFWHGENVKFILWGLLHAFYQIIGEITAPFRSMFFSLLGIQENGTDRKIIKMIFTFLLVTIGWILFRADSIANAFHYVKSMLLSFNPWVLFDGTMYTFGLDWKEWNVLLGSVMLLVAISFAQTKMAVGAWFLNRPLLIRCSIILVGVWSIILFGSYGYGFNAKDFIYGGF